jgi:hypothetical protein
MVAKGPLLSVLLGLGDIRAGSLHERQRKQRSSSMDRIDFTAVYDPGKVIRKKSAKVYRRLLSVGPESVVCSILRNIPLHSIFVPIIAAGLEESAYNVQK